MAQQPRIANRDFLFNIVALIALSSIIFGTVAWMLVVPTTVSEEEKTQQYFDSIGLEYKYLYIPVDKKIDLRAVALMPKNYKNAENGTIPALIHFDSINNLREVSINHTVSFAKMGFMVFMVEGRGYGESDGLNDFYGNEPKDVSKIIDFISSTYPMVNQTHFAGSGFTYGAGVMLIAQAIEPRIHASVLYQPPTNISHLFLQYRSIQFPDSLISNNTFLSGEETRDAFYWCNQSTTQNLMIIQGLNDKLIDPNKTETIYNHLNGTNRDDIQLIKRPGLDFSSTPSDIVSRKYAMAWFDHYFFNSSVDITNLDIEINYQEPFEYDPPSTESSRLLNWVGFILIEFGAWMAFRFVLYQYQKRKENDIPKNFMFGQWIGEKPQKSEKNQELPKNEKIRTEIRNFIYETLVLWGSSIIVGFITWAIDPNVFLGIFIGIPLISLIGFRYLRHPKELKEKLKFEKEPMKFTLIGTCAAVLPIVLATLLFDWTAHHTLQQVIWPWKPSAVFYTLMIILIFVWISNCIETFLRNRNKGLIVVIWGILIVTFLIYNLFVPIFPDASFLTVLFGIIGISFSLLILGIIVIFWKKVWGNTVVGTIFIAIIITLWLSGRYYYILI